MALLDASIVIIALPAIFRGIGLNPLLPSNIGYLLWLIMGYPLVTAVLVVSVGRLGDMYGRVRIYNLGFVVFTAGIDRAVARSPPRRLRRDLADRMENGPGVRRFDADGQLSRHPHGRVPRGSEGDGPRYQSDLPSVRSVHRAGRRRSAGRVGLGEPCSGSTFPSAFSEPYGPT